LHKRAKDILGGDTLPGRDELLAFIRGHQGKVGKREIAKAFDITGEARIALKHMLKDLQEAGVLERHGNRLRQPGLLPPVVLAEMRSRDRDGDLIATPVEWDEAHNGEAPRIAVHLPRRARPGLPAPGHGDRALLRVEPSGEDTGPAYRGRIIKILPKARAQTLGVFHARSEGGGRIVPIDRKSLGRELLVAAGDEGNAKDGDLVTVTPGRESRSGLSLVKVRETLASIKSEKAISLIAIYAHAIPTTFSPAALAEARAARPAALADREDWRLAPLVTIDPPDAKDHDDAVHAAP
jgi:ribonuclease R